MLRTAVINLIASFACCASAALAQDLKKDLNDVIAGIDSTSVSIEAAVSVRGRKGGAVIYSAKASVYRNGAASYTQLAEQEFLVTKTYEVHVDHEEKAILILKKDGKSDKKSTKSMDFEVSSLKEFLEEKPDKAVPRVILTANSQGVRTYSITNVSGMKEVRIVLNMNDRSIKSVSYEYAESSEQKGQLVTVEYTLFKKNAETADKLKTTRFFTEAEGKYVPSARLKNYRIYTEL
jgi:hypothetical protein